MSHSGRNEVPPVPPGGGWYSNAELSVRVAKLEDEIRTNLMVHRFLEREIQEIRRRLDAIRVDEEAARATPPRGLL